MILCVIRLIPTYEEVPSLVENLVAIQRRSHDGKVVIDQKREVIWLLNYHPLTAWILVGRRSALKSWSRMDYKVQQGVKSSKASWVLVSDIIIRILQLVHVQALSDKGAIWHATIHKLAIRLYKERNSDWSLLWYESTDVMKLHGHFLRELNLIWYLSRNYIKSVSFCWSTRFEKEFEVSYCNHHFSILFLFCCVTKRLTTKLAIKFILNASSAPWQLRRCTSSIKHTQIKVRVRELCASLLFPNYPRLAPSHKSMTSISSPLDHRILPP